MLDVSDYYHEKSKEIYGEDIKKLKGYDDLLRLRVGEYRIIYSVDNGKLIVYVVDAGNRGDIYRKYQDAQNERLADFIQILKAQDSIIVEFDEGLWSSMVDYIKVGKNKEMAVTFRDGTETIKI